MAKRQNIVRAIQRLGKRGRGCRYPDEVREAILVYVDERRTAGVALKAVGHEIGVSWRTLASWGKRRTAFRRVELPVTAAPSAGFIVHGPCGVRVEELALDDVVELLRRLA